MRSLFLNNNRVEGRVLVVAGSDPTGGAGLQADLKTVAALGGYAMTAVTAVTVQDTFGVKESAPLPGELVAAQMETCLKDMGADVIKLGLLGSGEVVRAVCGVLERYPHLPVVADPVLSPTAGKEFLDREGMGLMGELLKKITLLTPNLPEAEKLSGCKIRDLEDMSKAAAALSRLGPKGVLITGGHIKGDRVTDLFWEAGEESLFPFSRIPAKGGLHGTGCTITSAIATGLAQGLSPKPAVERGLKFIRRAIGHSMALGGGQRLLDHFAGNPSQEKLFL